MCRAHASIGKLWHWNKYSPANLSITWWKSEARRFGSCLTFGPRSILCLQSVLWPATRHTHLRLELTKQTGTE